MLLKMETLLISDSRSSTRNRGLLFLIFFVISIQLFFSTENCFAVNPGPLLEKGRELFYQSVEDKDKIAPAIEVFEQLQSLQQYEGRAQVYIGALTALRGKHSFLPQNKWKWTNRGLDIMDQGLLINPNDAEALFVHSSTCFYLPFFFKRGEQAQTYFKQILQVLPAQKDNYNPELINNILEFIQQNADLSKDEQNQLDSLMHGHDNEF